MYRVRYFKHFQYYYQRKPETELSRQLTEKFAGALQEEWNRSDFEAIPAANYIPKPKSSYPCLLGSTTEEDWQFGAKLFCCHEHRAPVIRRSDGCPLFPFTFGDADINGVLTPKEPTNRSLLDEAVPRVSYDRKMAASVKTTPHAGKTKQLTSNKNRKARSKTETEQSMYCQGLTLFHDTHKLLSNVSEIKEFHEHIHLFRKNKCLEKRSPTHSSEGTTFLPIAGEHTPNAKRFRYPWEKNSTPRTKKRKTPSSETKPTENMDEELKQALKKYPAEVLDNFMKKASVDKLLGIKRPPKKPKNT
jgi:hypothetical protein